MHVLMLDSNTDVKYLLFICVCLNLTVQKSGHIACVLLKAAVPLVEGNTAHTIHAQQQSSLQRFLQGKLSSTAGAKQ